jgi:hypothetical protein
MADPTDRHPSQCQLYKPRSKPASHLTRSAKLGCKGDGEAEQGALLYGRLSPLGRVLKAGCKEAFTNRTFEPEAGQFCSAQWAKYRELIFAVVRVV